jgi:hypothetical protein
MSRRYLAKSALHSAGDSGSADQDQILTATEAARLLKVHEITLFVWAREKRGPPALTPPGVRLRRYSKRDLLEWLRRPHPVANLR